MHRCARGRSIGTRMAWRRWDIGEKCIVLARRDVRGEGAVSVRGEGAFAVAACLSADALLGRLCAHAPRYAVAGMRLRGAVSGDGLTKARRWCGLGVYGGLATGIADALRRLFLVQGCGGVRESRDESHGLITGYRESSTF